MTAYPTTSIATWSDRPMFCFFRACVCRVDECPDMHYDPRFYGHMASHLGLWFVDTSGIWDLEGLMDIYKIYFVAKLENREEPMFPCP